MQKGNFFNDNEDIQFHLEHRLDSKKMFDLTSEATRDALGIATEQEYKTTWFEVLSTLGDMAANKIYPGARAVEAQHIKLLEDGSVEMPEQIKENIALLREGGFNAMGVGIKFGGLEGPTIFDMVAMELINRACPSTSLNACWWSSISHIIEQFADKELAEKYCTKIAADGWSGSMALTEPDAGSDLASMKTFGVRQDDGTYKLYGSKRFISNGNSEICLVLARKSKEDVGLSSLSLYLCPRKIDDSFNYQVSKLEEKVALHGSATCELNFDGSSAYLLGEAGDGFRYMLTLMNEARIGVSFQSIGIIDAVFQMAKTYASERETWGKKLIDHALIKEMLNNMEADLKAARSLAYKAASEFSIMQLLKKRLDEDIEDVEKAKIQKEISRYNYRVRTWTPLIKYYTSEKCVEHARFGLQILGGYGFTKEYDAERLLRESLIYPIYEGTSQIQALMCVKDTFKEAVRRPTEILENSIGLRIKGLAATNTLKRHHLKLRKMLTQQFLH